MELRLATLAMGTRFELVAFGDDPVELRAAGEAALETVEDAHRELSRFDPESLVSHLHRVGAERPVPVSRDLLALLADAEAVRVATAGAFDVARGTGSIHVDAGAATVRLGSASVRLDFGAIGKGHALDLAAAALREAGVGSAFIHGGTSSGVAIGRPPGRDGWRIALGPEADAPVVTLADQAWSFSAAVEGRRAAVVGPSARLADAWATALVLVGSRRAGPGPEWLVWLWTDGSGGSPAADRPDHPSVRLPCPTAGIF